ncbi:MAG: hypothetical protein ACT4NL_13355 [Pseudomarimonas sp.]
MRAWLADSGRLLATAALSTTLLASTLLANAQTPPSVPAELAPWVPWVLKDYPKLGCPFALGQNRGDESAHICAWPGALDLDVTADGARFSMTWTVLAESNLRLPGDARVRPQDVSVGGRSATVMFDGNQASLRLSPGVHRVEGSLSWSKRPTQLPVPDEIALVKLRLDGTLITVPERNGDQLWLGRITTEVGADTLNLKVFRRLDDGLPLRLTTQLMLEISGRAREISLPAALPEGFVPVAVQSNLPAAVLADGSLRVQLRPGTWPLTIEARAEGFIDSAGPPAAEVPWPSEEIWSWRAAPELRVVEVEGGTPVDPAQVAAPWGEPLSTHVLDRTQKLSIAERSRGKDDAQPHRLSLSRELWLAFDGGSMVARDQLNGQLARVGRLNATAPWTLQRATEGEQDLLVTRDDAGQIGVELRNPALNLVTTGEHAGRGRMPASGWAVDLESMSAVLNLPPGWRLFAVSGVDRAPDTWIGKWNLLDLFLLAVAGLLAFRLHGLGFAALVLAYLGLGYHENDSPLWSVLAVIALALLLRVLSGGRLSAILRVARAVMLSLAFLLALPFVAEQLKLALHPQLERGQVESSREYFDNRYAAAAQEVMAKSDQYQEAETLEEIQVTGTRIRRNDMEAASPAVILGEPTPMSIPAPPPAPPAPPMPQQSKSKQLNAYPDDAVLQAGPGTPDWRWQRIELGWSGPVVADQTMRLWLSPPWMTRCLRVIAVALLVLVLLRLARELKTLPNGLKRGAAALPAILLAVGLSSATNTAYAAGFPPTELLDELEERLLEAPKCAPQCASLDAVEVELAGDRMRVALILHAEADVAVPLPEPGKSAALLRADVGGSEVGVLRRNGERWISLPRGVQRVQLEWQIAAVDQIDLRFPLPPSSLRLAAEGWETGSLDGLRLLSDSLQLIRLRAPDAADAIDTSAAAQEFPPFVKVTRTLDLDLDWTVLTVVQRVAPMQTGFALNLPLLADERVLDDSLEVTDGQVKLNFAANEHSKSWRSRLPISDQLQLSMGSLARSSERWEVRVGAYWHADFSGLPQSSIEAGDGLWRYDPRPDETLTIALSRPAAVAGSSLAFDQVTLAMAQGSRARSTTLTAELRSTRGGQHAITLPEDAELISVSINGQTRALRLEKGQLRVPVLPGPQSLVLSWRRPIEVGFSLGGDTVDLGAPVANLRTQLSSDDDRWLLAAGGSGIGPAVLYWGQLLVMLLIAAGLARLATGTPLRFHHWLLLGLGFSTVSWIAAGVVVAWLLLLAWRQRKAGWIVGHPVFPLVQLLLVLASVIAMLALLSAIPYGLLGSPDMQISGNGSSSGLLRWFNDASSGALPTVWTLSLPLWVYKLAILVWALWLANALIGWLRWGWQSFSAGGVWPPRKPKPAPAAKSEETTSSSADASSSEASQAAVPPLP